MRAEEDEALLGCEMNPRETILRLSGLHLNEALTLTNCDVDLSKGEIRVRTSNSEAGYCGVPIVPELRPQAWHDFLQARGLYHPDGPSSPPATTRR
jgi:hypothetical protein